MNEITLLIKVYQIPIFGVLVSNGVYKHPTLSLLRLLAREISIILRISTHLASQYLLLYYLAMGITRACRCVYVG